MTCLSLVTRGGVLKISEPGQAAGAGHIVKGEGVTIPDRDTPPAAQVGAAQVI